MKFKYLSLSICCLFFLSSCAKDTGRARSQNQDKVNPQVQDPLKGKSNSEILNMKYDSLAMTCVLSAEFNSENQVVASHVLGAESLETNSIELNLASNLSQASAIAQDKMTDPPPSPVTNNNEKTVFDLKAQLAADPTLKDEQLNAKMVLNDEERDTSLELRIKPVIFFESLNLKNGSSVYLMKHSPSLKMSYSFTLRRDDRNSTTIPGNFNEALYEGIPFRQIITSETVAGKLKNFIVNCELKGTFKTGGVNYSDQWLKIDCSKPAEAGRENLHQKNCQDGKPVPGLI